MGDYDAEGFKAWQESGSPLYQEGAGGSTTLASKMIPQTGLTPANQVVNQIAGIQAPAANPPVYTAPTMMTPGQLGFSQGIQQQFAAAGINEIPEWMGRFAAGNRDLSNLVKSYQRVTDPTYDPSKAKGKAEKIYNSMINGGYGDNYTYGGSWGPSDQDFFNQAYIARKTKPNEGAWHDSISPALSGIASIAAPIAGLGALGAFSAPVAGSLAGGALSSEATMAIPEMMTANSIAAGIAGGADVGMGAGTGLLTNLGWPASYGLSGTEIGNLLSGQLGIEGLGTIGGLFDNNILSSVLQGVGAGIGAGGGAQVAQALGGDTIVGTSPGQTQITPFGGTGSRSALGAGGGINPIGDTNIYKSRAAAAMNKDDRTLNSLLDTNRSGFVRNLF